MGKQTAMLAVIISLILPAVARADSIKGRFVNAIGIRSGKVNMTKQL